MTQSSPTRHSSRSRRETRRDEISSAVRALRGEAPVRKERRGPSAAQRHDVPVAAILAAIFLAGAALHGALAAPSEKAAEHGALKLSRPGGWLPAATETEPLPRLARAALALAGDDRASEAAGTERWVYAFPAAPMTRIEVEIRPRPPYSNLPAALALGRAVRHGRDYGARATEARAIAGRDWFRTEFRYAYGGSRTPRVARAVEYAAPSWEELYVITLHGDADTARALEDAVAPSLTLSAERAERGGAP